jgi:hypothetical protein
MYIYVYIYRALQHIQVLAAASSAENMADTRERGSTTSSGTHTHTHTHTASLRRGLQLIEARLRAEWAVAVVGEGGRGLVRSHDARARALDLMRQAVGSTPEDLVVQTHYGQFLTSVGEVEKGIQVL